MPEHLELPRPLRLLRTMAWSLSESAGIPIAALAARGPRPLCARLAAEVIALRQPATHQPGLHRFFQGATWLWAGVFLLLAAGLAVLLATEPTATFLLLSAVATIALIVAGTAASMLWFRSVLRRLGL